MYIRVYVTPDARREVIEDGKDGLLRISVKEPAAGNRANRRVCELVAERFNIPAARIVTGHRSRSKLVSIDNQ